MAHSIWTATTTALIIALIATAGRADDSHIVLYNQIDNCKSNEYFDANYFMCRLCDPQLYLVPSENGQTCTCHPNAVTEIVYDSSFRQPICRPTNCTLTTTTTTRNCNVKPAASSSPTHCPLFHLREAMNLVQPSKYIQIVDSTSSMRCKNVSQTHCDRTVTACRDAKIFDRFEDYCIPQTLLKDYQSYRLFKVATPNAIDIYANLDFLAFFCQTLRAPMYCEHIANLCVLSNYAMDKYSPCNVFYASQTTLYTSNGIDGTQTKMVPFLFYPKGRNVIDDIDKVIDHRYKYKQNGEDYEAEGVDALGYYSVFAN